MSAVWLFVNISPVWAINTSWALGNGGATLWPVVWESKVGSISGSYGPVLESFLMFLNELWELLDISSSIPVLTIIVASKVTSGSVWHENIFTTSLASNWEFLWEEVDTTVINITISIELSSHVWVLGVVIPVFIAWDFDIIASAGFWVILSGAETSIESGVPLEEDTVNHFEEIDI